MGNCIGSEDNKSSYASYFSSDLILYENPEVSKPLPTSLFNTLRKPTECVIVTGNTTTLSTEVDILCIDFKNATPNSLKTLLNFKKIVYIGERGGQGEAEIQKVRAHVSYSKFYVVSQSAFRQFLQDFPIFTKKNWTKHEMAPNKLPLMLIDSKQFVRAISSRIRLFVHASSKMNVQIYALLGIKKESMMIKQPPSGSTVQRTKGHYVDALASSQENIVIMLHSQSMSAGDILETICTVLQEKHKIPNNHSQVYLKKNWPNSNFTQDKVPTLTADPVAKTASIIESSVDRFKKYFQKLQGQSSLEKTQRAYNLLSTLLINIYSNPNEDSYRQVKRTNRQMNDLLIKHKHGLKLLDELGFREKDEHWVNTVQTKYLKIYKTDLDLGFKRYKSKEQQ